MSLLPKESFTPRTMPTPVYIDKVVTVAERQEVRKAEWTGRPTNELDLAPGELASSTLAFRAPGQEASLPLSCIIGIGPSKPCMSPLAQTFTT